jgi:peptidoglycan/xylan/chitin deacetylase (PgdA/CDA1 family)
MMKNIVLHSIGITPGQFVLTQHAANRVLSYAEDCRVMFDDGYRSVHNFLLNANRANLNNVSLFLVVGKIGGTNDWDSSCELAGKPLLDWEQVDELKKAGVRFGSHSLTHANLTKLKNNELDREIKESKRILEERLGDSIDCFSYPFGVFNDQVIAALRNAGYKWAVTTSDSIWEGLGNPYRIRRISISGLDPEWLLTAKLNGLYDIKAFWDLPKLVADKIMLTLTGNS